MRNIDVRAKNSDNRNDWSTVNPKKYRTKTQVF